MISAYPSLLTSPAVDTDMPRVAFSWLASKVQSGLSAGPRARQNKGYPSFTVFRAGKIVLTNQEIVIAIAVHIAGGANTLPNSLGVCSPTAIQPMVSDGGNTSPKPRKTGNNMEQSYKVRRMINSRVDSADQRCYFLHSPAVIRQKRAKNRVLLKLL